MNVAPITTQFEQQIAFAKPTVASESNVADECFAGLVNRQAKFVYSVAYSVLRNAHDAEDVVQDTFLKLYRTGKWQQMADERAFLARTCWRIAVDRIPRFVKEAPGIDRPSTETNPERAALEADLTAAVHRLIDGLPEELRQPLGLSTVEELTSHEIAAIMGIPEGTVRTRLMRARQVLKLKLQALMAVRHEK